MGVRQDSLSIRDLELDWRDIEDRPDDYSSLPTHTYYDPSVYEFELDAVFSRRWQFRHSIRL